MKVHLLRNFDQHNEPDFRDLMVKAAASVLNNPNFPVAGWPAAIPTPTAFSAEVTAYDGLYKAAENGDKVAIKARNTARPPLTSSAQKVAGYLDLVADGNVAMLSTTGFELSRTPVKTVVHEMLPAPADFKVKRGPGPASAIAHARSLDGATTYYLQICVSDPGVGANWTAAGEYEHCNRIDVPGLTTGKLTYFRLCGWNEETGMGLWATSPGLQIL